MICATCSGEGWVWPGGPVDGPESDPEPCPDCGGCGLAYCCEGAIAEAASLVGVRYRHAFRARSRADRD